VDDHQMTRAAVYDLYWNTYGGGEQFAGAIASVLSERFDVDLIGPEPIDCEQLTSRLGLDLSRCGTRNARNDREVTALSADYDLLVNTTFLSSASSHARRGLYVVHFPGALSDPKVERKDDLRRRFGTRGRQPTLIAREGVHVRRDGVEGRLTDGAAKLELSTKSGREMSLTVAAPKARTMPSRVRVVGGATTWFDGQVGSDATVITFPLQGGEPEVIWLISEADDPATLGLPWHLNRVGVELRAAAVDGTAVSIDASRVTVRLTPPDRLGFLDTYQRIASNAAFTAGWVDRLWHRPSSVLYPAVRQLAPHAKTNTIVGVGRFFGAAAGHSKKQLEMVEAFRLLHESGQADGWTLHLIGGAAGADRDYAMAVRRAAQGLPITVHFNAPGSLVQQLVGEASIYWHAAGYGEVLATHPDRFEHFGISVVEAMSAACAPVVLGAAGPAEVIRDGVDGRHFHTIEELARITTELIADPAERGRLQFAAADRARHFSYDAFRPRLFDLVDDLLT
jgi:glycosyltransferase involved in cell wall biosynthesis